MINFLAAIFPFAFPCSPEHQDRRHSHDEAFREDGWIVIRCSRCKKRFLSGKRVA